MELKRKNVGIKILEPEVDKLPPFFLALGGVSLTALLVQTIFLLLELLNIPVFFK